VKVLANEMSGILVPQQMKKSLHDSDFCFVIIKIIRLWQVLQKIIDVVFRGAIVKVSIGLLNLNQII
jgi:hypothetical protein